jgi:energy-coupling factor transporter transmembrane protein EcfT
MGLYTTFFISLVLLAVTLLTIWLLAKKRWIKNTSGILLLLLAILFLTNFTLRWFYSKTKLNKNDYHGEYIINRDLFSGKQTDWQYNHFRFKITENDSIHFYLTNKKTILKTFSGKVRTTPPNIYPSARLIIEMDTPTHHILTSNPTTIRGSWNFYLVFESPKFHNVFFKKGKWQPIE